MRASTLALGISWQNAHVPSNLSTTLLALCAVVWSHATAVASDSTSTCAAHGERELPTSLLEHFAAHGVHLVPQTVHGGLKTDWVVVDAQPRGYEVRTSFIVFLPGTSPQRIREHMMPFNEAWLVNDAAQIAMFHPWGVCTMPDESACKSARLGSGVVVQKLIDVFRLYAPPRGRQAPTSAHRQWA